MNEEILRTDVDDFMELVRKNGKITLKDAAVAMRVHEQTIEAWTDFLVEERILGTEYKFTTQYVFAIEYANNPGATYANIETKEDFYDKALKKKIPQHLIKVLWLKYLEANKDRICKVFEQKAKEKGLAIDKINGLWNRYYCYLCD